MEILNPAVFKIVSGTSQNYDGLASGWWAAFASNSNGLVIPAPGVWRLFGVAKFYNQGGGAPPYQSARVGWRAANGANSAADPAAVSTLGGVTVLSSYSDVYLNYNATNGNEYWLPAPELIIDCRNATTTVFLDGITVWTTSANGKVQMFMNAMRVGL